MFFVKFRLTYDEWGSTKWKSKLTNSIIITTIKLVIIIMEEERVYSEL